MKATEEITERVESGVKVKTISVTYERKLNMGNYESATVGVSMWADLDGEVVGDVFAELWATAKAQVKEQLTPLDEWRRRNEKEDY